MPAAAPPPPAPAPKPEPKQLVIYGNPCEGFTFVGPFADLDEAAAYADDHKNIRDDTYWYGNIEAPEADWMADYKEQNGE